MRASRKMYELKVSRFLGSTRSRPCARVFSTSGGKSSLFSKKPRLRPQHRSRVLVTMNDRELGPCPRRIGKRNGDNRLSRIRRESYWKLSVSVKAPESFK